MSMRTAHVGHEAFSLTSSKHWTYDVFLSFRGEDTRNKFTGHLYTALEAAGTNVFIDDSELTRGEDITAELVQAIQWSRISVVVFSRSYAASRFCLEELVKILECRRTMGQMVFPIFYDVDPSEVRKQIGSFAEAFVKYEVRFGLDMDKVMSWRSALAEAANLSGWDLRNTADGNEAKFIRKIVDEISGKLNKTYLFEVVYPVGLNYRVQCLSDHLDVGSDDVRIVGILGSGGMGKTAVAKAIYNKCYQSFDGKSFLANVRGTAEQPNPQVRLQEQLLSDILRPTKIEVGSVDRGINVIKERLQNKRVLVIIDDVDQMDQLNAIAGNHNWFGSGSRIIITTRDEHLLKQLGVNSIYSAQRMTEEEALELFSWHAFRNSYPNGEYTELARSAVSYCDGLPLALEVIGSFLFGRTVPEWKSELEKLRRIPHQKIQEKLRISFDGLNDDVERDIFLDISCFFIGMDKNYASQILNGCGFFAEIGISVLLQRCLVTVDENNKLMIHDLLRDMGREIIREKSPKEPGKRSRLWSHEDVSDVLTKHSGSEEIEGLALNVPKLDKVSFSANEFTKMHSLRLLQLNYVQLSGGYEYLSKELRWLCWHGLHLKFIPKDFNLRNLVAIDLKYSKLTRSWKDPVLLEKLKILNFSHSHYLTQSPDFSKLPNLEQLILKECKSLSKVHQSIGHLERLSLVNLKDCIQLKDLPRSLYKSKSIKILVLSGCSIFENLDEDLGEMASLTTLLADRTAIIKVPFTILRLKNLTHLSLSGLKGSPSNSLSSLLWTWVFPGNISKSPDLMLPSLRGLNSLQDLFLGWCNLTDGAIPEDVWSLPTLRSLDLRSNSFQTLPSLSGLSKLQVLVLDYCEDLHAIPELPKDLLILSAYSCTAVERMADLSEMSSMAAMFIVHCSNKLVEIPGIDKLNSSLVTVRIPGCKNIAPNLKEMLLQGWDLCGECGVFLYGKDIPRWFPYVVDGASIAFELPQVIDSFNGFIVCIAYSYCHKTELSYPYAISFMDHTKGTMYTRRLPIAIKNEDAVEDELWVGREEFLLEGGHRIEVIVDFGPAFTVKKTGLSLVRDAFIDGKMIRSLVVSIDDGLLIESFQCNNPLSSTNQVNKSPSVASRLPGLRKLVNFLSNIDENF